MGVGYYHKTALNRIKMKVFAYDYNSNVSCMPKTQILSFITSTLFARFLRDSLFISSKMCKNGSDHKNSKLP